MVIKKESEKMVSFTLFVKGQFESIFLIEGKLLKYLFRVKTSDVSTQLVSILEHNKY